MTETVKEIKDQVVLITGGSKGIGAACVEAFFHQGYRIALHFRSDPERAKAFADSLSLDPYRIKTYCFDLAQDGACESLIKSVKEDFGTVDVLINNAGRAIDQILPLAKPGDFETLLNTNLKPVFALSKAVSKLMIRQKFGVILQISSVIGFTGNPGQSMYAATKAGIIGFNKSIAQELAAYGIRCNTIAPGFISTEMTDSLNEDVRGQILKKIPMNRFGLPKDVAQAALFLASSGGNYITGSTIHVNGGMYTN